MKKIITILFIFVIISLIFIKSGFLNKIDINNYNEVKKYLQSNNFQYFEMKAGMTSFLVFWEKSVDMKIYIGEKNIFEKSYKYQIGEKEKNYRKFNIENLEGVWKIKEDGNIYLWNKGELFVYSPFSVRKK